MAAACWYPATGTSTRPTSFPTRDRNHSTSNAAFGFSSRAVFKDALSIPNCPELPSPNANTEPSFVVTSVKYSPAATSTAKGALSVPVSASVSVSSSSGAAETTTTSFERSSGRGNPSRPLPPSAPHPNANALPFSSAKTAWHRPASTATTEVFVFSFESLPEEASSSAAASKTATSPGVNAQRFVASSTSTLFVSPSVNINARPSRASSFGAYGLPSPPA
mmetsp:Transcript_14911/g.62949  ORF Transcript_14911/g.62949 Transcript_14911/m.62949 type:complete len:221 (-) Transcript_14911:739-1401(-)